MLRKLLLAGFLTALGALGVCASAADPQPKRVLVLFDEDKDNFPGLSTIDRRVREAFKSELGQAVEIHAESMGLSRSGRPDFDLQVAHHLRSKYAGWKPDLLVAVLEPPLDFLLKHAGAMFPNVPVVFCGVDATTVKDKKLPPNFTGVLLKRAYSPTLEVALRLQPATRNVFVVGGASPYDRYLQAFVRRDLQPFERGVAIHYLFDMDMDDLLKRLSALPPQSVILYVTVFGDAAGRRFVPHEVLSSITARANAPVYVFLDQYVGLGSVGGNVYSTDAHGTEVARLGLKVLRGAPPESLPIEALAAQVNLFDARQLQSWNLSPARLPPGSIVRYQDPSVWETYRWYIAAAIALLLMQGALIARLLVARRHQRRAETEALRQRDDLAHVLRVQTLGELTTELAHEISQPLSAILLNAQAAIRFIAGGKPTQAKEVEGALADIVASAEHASSVLGRLRTLFRKERVEKVPVDVKALIEDVVNLLHAAMLIERIDIRLVFGRDVPAVFGDPVQLEQVLLNVVRNACDSIGASQGGPRVITIETRENRLGHVAIDVSDTGIGLPAADLERIFEHFMTSKPKGLGMGLAISRSIISAHGGLIWASANADRGLTVHIELVAWISDESARATTVKSVRAA